MGQITSRLVRPFRNFNVDNRAAKVLEQRQKNAVPPPNYPSTVERLSRFREEHPEFLEAQNKRDEKLHEHLKKVSVESTGSSTQTTASTKPYPFNRKPPPETDMGALEQTSDVPEGRASLKTVFSFLGQHRSDPHNFTAAKIAVDNKLEEKAVQNVLHYFKILHLHIPKIMYEQKKDMKKIIADQLKAASSVATPFVLPEEPKEEKSKAKPQIGVSPTKT